MNVVMILVTNVVMNLVKILVTNLVKKETKSARRRAKLEKTGLSSGWQSFEGGV